MFDKILHFLMGGSLGAFSDKPVFTALIFGVGWEVFNLFSGIGVFDWWDIVATLMGGLLVNTFK